MIRKFSPILTVALMAICGGLSYGQSLSQTTLKIDVENAVEYQDDIGDPSQFATKPNTTPSKPPKNFYVVTLFADIVAVNGQPAKGTYIGRSRAVSLNPAATGAANAEAIGDVTRTALREHLFEILQPDGRAIGTIMSIGLSGGPAPPGTSSTERANWAIVGGTGAFLGARGIVSGTGGVGRAASMAEDPVNRRTNGGTSYSFIVHIIPMSQPQIIQTPNGPAIVHSSDFTLVGSLKPAAAGETLSLFATGLGPTVPAVDLGDSFPANPLAVVNSPLTVSVNGKSADVLAAVGYPGSTDGYQVNFRVPPDTVKGLANVQVTSAWISGQVVSINVQ